MADGGHRSKVDYKTPAIIFAGSKTKSSSTIKPSKQSTETDKSEEDNVKVEIKESLNEILSVLKSIKGQIDKSISNQEAILKELKLQVALTATTARTNRSVDYSGGILRVKGKDRRDKDEDEEDPYRSRYYDYDYGYD